MAHKKSDSFLDLSSTEEMLLYAVRNRDRYGLEIVDTIWKVSNGKRKVGFNSLYPTLKKLEKDGFVTSRWGNETPQELTAARRRYYSITEKGCYTLNEKEMFLSKLGKI